MEGVRGVWRAHRLVWGLESYITFLLQNRNMKISKDLNFINTSKKRFYNPVSFDIIFSTAIHDHFLQEAMSFLFIMWVYC